MLPIKAVRIMADWARDGVWHLPGTPRESLDGFRISDELHARLRRWVDCYCKLDRAEGYSGECHPPDWGAFNAEGYAIALAVKAELPDWLVVYVDETLVGLRSQATADIVIPDRLH